ncbi:hypothetical protein KIL84_011380 [Mauremys mutica]|uniref:Uncharacterized protein n=1 Tax=Mauremys mutica TaxID=74926 RepID=A0A9D3XDA1_9SAUR|nr:hypothetical protein KIL84_011380 [Mauremys mutica]
MITVPPQSTMKNPQKDNSSQLKQPRLTRLYKFTAQGVDQSAICVYLQIQRRIFFLWNCYKEFKPLQPTYFLSSRAKQNRGAEVHFKEIEGWKYGPGSCKHLNPYITLIM